MAERITYGLGLGKILDVRVLMHFDFSVYFILGARTAPQARSLFQTELFRASRSVRAGHPRSQ